MPKSWAPFLLAAPSNLPHPVATGGHLVDEAALGVGLSQVIKRQGKVLLRRRKVSVSHHVTQCEAEGKFQGLHIDAWREVYYRNSPADNENSKRVVFHRARRDLVDLKYLTVHDDIYTPIGFWAPWERQFLGEQLNAAKNPA